MGVTAETNSTTQSNHIAEAEAIAKDITTKYNAVQVNEMLSIIKERIKTQRDTDLNQLETRIMYLKEAIGKLA